ncbi:GD18096 [Drosophila simulans]|uniref:GD18096 n=2 Tax=Drosophila simulans TaxID=7240 RepID=B4QXE2_DROSI|nr:GD18096 [Drosophila simulans]
MDGENRCSPVCPGGCKNGFCVAPGKCSCDEGYSMETENSCTPICSRGCENGFCDAPEKCSCYDGYAMASENRCSAVCSGGCKNGFCVAPGKCSCYEGYSMETENSCTPNCSRGCENGFCDAPEKCSCNDGYAMDSGNRCSPVCSGGCKNGFCVAPGKCSCNEGYRNETEISCVPFCKDGCVNGLCVSPDVCKCDDGYIFVEESKSCQLEKKLHGHSDCDQNCRNGTCVEGICTCSEEYKLHRNEDDNNLICLPICEPECLNGFCEFPGSCVCWDGESPIDGYLCQSMDSLGSLTRQEKNLRHLKWVFITIGAMAFILAIIVAMLMTYIFKKRSYHVDKNEREFGVYFSPKRADIIRA